MEPNIIARIRQTVQETNLDALVWALPANVLLLSGYWPVVGISIAIATRAGRIALLTPEDEYELATQGWADSVRTFQPGSLISLTSVTEAAREPLAALLQGLDLSGTRIGYEDGEASEPATYAAMHLYDSSLADLLRTAAPDVTSLHPAYTRLPDFTMKDCGDFPMHEAMVTVLQDTQCASERYHNHITAARRYRRIRKTKQDGSQIAGVLALTGDLAGDHTLGCLGDREGTPCRGVPLNDSAMTCTSFPAVFQRGRAKSEGVPI